MAAYGQLVTGPPGAGKTTYCHGMHQFLTALNRPVAIINLDPAVPNPPYPCALNISSLITLQDIMDEHQLGPNGAMIYAMEYLEANVDWLEEGLKEIVGREERGSAYIVFDTPGQVEIWTNHGSLKRVLGKLIKQDYRLVSVHLSDAHYITDPSKYISLLLLALRSMLQLELPHVNVLSKMDLLKSYGQLPLPLRFYTQAQDLERLVEVMVEDKRGGDKFRKMNEVICELVESFGLVGFETLAVEDKGSMLKLLRLLDRVVGYAYVPKQPLVSGGGRGATTGSNNSGSGTNQPTEIPSIPLSDLIGIDTIDDIQEKWVADGTSGMEDEWKVAEDEENEAILEDMGMPSKRARMEVLDGPMDIKTV